MRNLFGKYKDRPVEVLAKESDFYKENSKVMVVYLDTELAITNGRYNGSVEMEEAELNDIESLD